MDPATTPPVGTHQGQAVPPAGTPAPQGDPSLLLWENPLFSGCWDKDEGGRGFLEGRAAGTVWGNTRQGLGCDKAPAGAGELEGLSDKGNRGQPAPAALNTPKPPFILSTASQAWGELGDSEGLCPPGLTAGRWRSLHPWEVQDAAPLCRAFSSPHPLLSHGSWHRGCAKPHRRCSCAGACRAPCPPPCRGGASQEPKIASTPGALAAGSAGVFRGASTWEGGGWGDALGALPCLWHSRGWRFRGRHRRCARLSPSQQQARHRGGGMGKPRFWVSRRHRKCAGMASCPLLSHPTAAIPKLGAELGAAAGI